MPEQLLLARRPLLILPLHAHATLHGDAARGVAAAGACRAIAALPIQGGRLTHRAHMKYDAQDEGTIRKKQRVRESWEQLMHITEQGERLSLPARRSIAPMTGRSRCSVSASRALAGTSCCGLCTSLAQLSSRRNMLWIVVAIAALLASVWCSRDARTIVGASIASLTRRSYELPLPSSAAPL